MIQAIGKCALTDQTASITSRAHGERVKPPSDRVAHAYENRVVVEKEKKRKKKMEMIEEEEEEED
jgi:hypothetical protein